MSLEKTIRFYSYDTLPDKTIKPSSILKQMQQIAREDLDQFGLTYQNMRKENMIFVLTKLNLRIYRPMAPEQELQLNTNPRKVLGATFYRDFRITDSDYTYAECATSWVLIDFIKRRPLRPSSLPFEIPHNCEDELKLPLEKTFTLEGDESKVGERQVFYSSLDENNHLNNTVYADFACDYLPKEFTEKDKKTYSLQINFLNEAFLGNNLTFHRIVDNNKYLLTVENNTLQKKCFQSLIEFHD